MTHVEIRAAASEAAGTCLLVATVVGSGIMAERLSQANAAIALFANSLATGGALFALISTFAPISGAHLNPVVSLAALLRGTLTLREFALYVLAQMTGALTGVVLAHLMFDLPLIEFSNHARASQGEFISEIVATFGLISVILGSGHRSSIVPFAVAGYITAAYWFTASTSFANPAVTVARSLTNTFSGIRPFDVPQFILAQVIGAVAATYFFTWLQHTREGTNGPR